MTNRILTAKLDEGDYVLIISNKDHGYQSNTKFHNHLFVSDGRVAEIPLGKDDFQKIAGMEWQGTVKTPSDLFIQAAIKKGYLSELFEKFSEDYIQPKEERRIAFPDMIMHCGPGLMFGMEGDTLHFDPPNEQPFHFNARLSRFYTPLAETEQAKTRMYKTDCIDRIVIGLENVREELNKNEMMAIYTRILPE